MARLAILALAAAAAGLAGQSLLSEGGNNAGHSTIGATVLDCNLKGNISLNTGERIYHVPGQEHYSETVITPSKGERWFCSEDAARAGGWRKAMR
jgi:hypothetical protein